MALTRVLVTVKTYPTLSGKYEELVCTAGFREDGTWIRIYPVPFRKKTYDQQYKKYDWIEVDLIKKEDDFRPESYKPRYHNTEIRVVGHMDADGGPWLERRKICLQRVFTNLDSLLEEARVDGKRTSLAVFKPTKIKSFDWEPVSRTWDLDKLKKIAANRQQLNLFEDLDQDFKLVNKLPYKFVFRFQDDTGREANLMIEDWETGQLYWNSLRQYGGNEESACQAVKNKYFYDFARKKDLHFYLGTVHENHAKNYPNPFVIIGTFHPTHDIQGRLF